MLPETQTISRKEQIIKVAGELFRERGFHATSMRDLAAEIGIEPASLYSHIKSKEDILEQICFGMANAFYESVEEIKTSSLPVLERLENAVVNHVEVIKNNVDEAGVFFNDWRHLTEPRLSEFKRLRKEYENIFRNMIQEGVENGDFRPVDYKLATLTLFSSLNWVHNWYKSRGDMVPKEVDAGIADLVIHGLKQNNK